MEKVKTLQTLRSMKQKELFYKLQEVEVLKSLNLNTDISNGMLESIDSIIDLEFMKGVHLDNENIKKSKVLEKKYYSIKELLETLKINKTQSEIDEILLNSLNALKNDDLEKIKLYEDKTLNILFSAVKSGEKFDENLDELLQSFNEEDRLLLKRVFKYEEDLSDDINRLNNIIKEINGMLLAVIPNKNNFIM